MASDFFTPAQREVIRNANASFNFLCGAVRSGKTHVSYFLVPERINRHWNNEVYFVGKTLSTLNRNILEPMRKIFGSSNISQIIDKQYVYAFGKKCWCVGANDDRAVTKIQGASAGYFYCDEIVTYPENFFEMMLSRLDKAGSVCDATCNPESPSHYIKQFIDKPENQKYIYQRQFTIYDNTKLPRETVERLEDMYRGTIYFDRWILGKWVRCEGLVFPLFNRDRHYITPAAYSMMKHTNTHRIRYCIVGGDGATTNDATALVPLFIFDDGSAAVGDIFYHDPKENGQYANIDLLPHIARWYQDIIDKYSLNANVEFYTAIDSAASDLIVTLRSRLPERYRVTAFGKKDIVRTTETVNNAFAKDMVHIFDFGGYRNYVRNQWVAGLSPLVKELETMIWLEGNEKYDPTVPNDAADAFRYAVNAYFNNPENLWQTPIER